MLGARIKPRLCPYCGYCGDAASDSLCEGKRPKPDDWAMCIACGGMTVFQDDLSMRKLRDEELAEAEPELREHIARMQSAQKAMAHKVKRDVSNA